MEKPNKQRKKVIVLEGLDASGKRTQSIKLQTHYQLWGLKTKLISFPNYEIESGHRIQQYLHGELDLDPWKASHLYSENRYMTLKDMDLDDVDVVIFDRYATSNYLYQMPKLPYEDWLRYIKLQEMGEYSAMKLPRPTDVIFLDVLPEHSQQLLIKRGQTLDEHEKDIQIQVRARNAAKFAAEKLNWKIVECYNSDGLLSEEEVFNRIRSVLNLI